LVVVVEVVVAVGGVGGGVVVVPPAFADAQLGPQPVKVSAAAVVFQLAGHLYLLGLGSAAPHWLDPLEHAGPCLDPCSLLLAIQASCTWCGASLLQRLERDARFEPACIY